MNDSEHAPDPKSIKREEVAKLATDASTCTRCDLHRTRTKVVFGVGNPSSPLMLVGEGPGANEDATGLPFVGRAGKLLDECLREAGMKREHVYITNIVKCRACIIEGPSIRNRVPNGSEIETCVPLWLHRQIDAVQPRVILCLGAPAANVILGRPIKITRERGQWFDSRFSRFAMAALHPAYILRQEGQAFEQARRSLVDDLNSAKIRAREAMTQPNPTLF